MNPEQRHCTNPLSRDAEHHDRQWASGHLYLTYLRFGRFVFLHEEKNERCRDKADCDQQSDEEIRSHSNGAFPGASWFAATSCPRPTVSRLLSKTLVEHRHQLSPSRCCRAPQ
jgi:hypothetical protein